LIDYYLLVQNVNKEVNSQKISIIIPVLNEIGPIAATIASTYSSKNIETIVVDGGSIDGTVELVRSLAPIVLSAPKGRAAQMNAGAAAATGEILLFLHADTRLPPDFDRIIRTALETPLEGSENGVVAGAFALQIDSPLRSLRAIEWGVSCRSRFLQMPYGDQAIFLTAKTFHQIGGFAELPIMEDFDLIARLKNLGKIAIVSEPVVTSPRRWLKKGVIQTTLMNQIIILGYVLGVSPDRLARWYKLSRKS
jgi:rSAM/selenodomain-associated transferase 2